jgi:hypothetical protein
LDNIAFGFYKHLAGQLGNHSITKEDPDYIAWFDSFKPKHDGQGN